MSYGAALRIDLDRASPEAIRRQAGALASMELLREVLDASPCITVVVNRHRQIVYSNRATLALLGAASPQALLGRRTGEALGCIHSGSESGCGASEACQMCGAVLCMQEALAGCAGCRECRITRRDGDRLEWLDLEVSATPVVAAGEHFAAVSLVDISDQKRRRALERIFFHDVLNTAGSAQGLAEAVARRASGGDLERLAGTLLGVTRQLVREILSQRTLAAAETGELAVEPVLLRSLEVLREEIETLRGCPAYGERRLELDPASEDVPMTSDRVLLGRVLDNMLRNAIEATLPGGTVEAGCREAGEEVEFWVRNPGEMPRQAQLQVFQRSFSTKGSGRGLGAYSMKLLTERYLGGTVSFQSSPEDGTVFRARYPRSLR